MSSDSLEKLYTHRFEESLEYRRKVWAVMVADFFQQFVDRGDTVLDLGCGYCMFINNVVCARKYALDLNPTAERMAGSDVTLFLQDSSRAWPVEAESVDVIFTSNFFEHLPTRETLEKTVAHAFAALKPGGKLIAMGPNIRLLPGEYWDFWDHHLPLSERSLGELLTNTGFTMQLSHPRFLPYSMVDAPRYPTAFLSWYLRLPFFWRFFGRQFLLAATKPGSRQSTP